MNSYIELVRKFPLYSIRTDEELKASVEVLDSLLQRTLDEGEQQYLHALTDLIAIYEKNNIKIEGASEAEMIKFLLEEHKINASTLAKQIGIAQSTISAVLNGKRTLTKDNIIKIAKHFNVSPAIFFPKVTT